MAAPSRFAAHPRPRFADGTTGPSVTGVLGELAKPALYIWNNKMGLKGIDTRKYVDEKAKAGTLAHAMILADLANIHPDWKEYEPYVIDQAENSFLKWLDWKKRHTIEPILTEKPLVSEKYRYGGIIDCYAKVDGCPTLVDFKTSKAIYDEMWYQVAAYKQMLEEDGRPVLECRILQIGRDETEGFNEQMRHDLTLQFEIFQHALGIYYAKRKLKGE